MLHIAIAQQIGATVLPNVGGWAGALTFPPSKNEWYNDLKKPKWYPPTWAFGPAWTVLYSSMGYASYLVWRDGGGCEGARLPLTLYGVQLAINWAWTPMFFGGKSTKLGLVNMAFLIPTAAGCAYEFFKVNHVAGGLLVPYILWLGFACFLNFTVHQLNMKQIKPEEKKEN